MAKERNTLMSGLLGFIKVVISIVLAILVLSIGLWSFQWITGVEAIDSLQQGNVAIGVAVAGLLIAIAVVLGPTIASVRIE